MTASDTLGEQFDDHPVPIGTTPIPEGHIRFFHQTWERHANSISQHGLLESHAKGDGGLGAGNEPSAGVWASTGRVVGGRGVEKPDAMSERALVEFHAHPSEISGRAESPWHSEDPVKWGEGYHHVIMHGDVKPEQIVAVHRPWHAAADYLSGESIERLADLKDFVHNDPTMHNYARGHDYLFSHENTRTKVFRDRRGSGSE